MNVATEAMGCMSGGFTGPIPIDEADRIDALRGLRLLDTAPSESFDTVTRLAAGALRLPICLVSLVDAERQWFKSRVGMEERETPRNISFCTHAVFDRKALVVPDATLDPRFALNPLVTGTAHIRAYLGIPLYTHNRQPVGTLCGIDRRARPFSEHDIATLTEFAKIIEIFMRERELAAKTGEVLRFAEERERLFRETFEQAAVGMAHVSRAGVFTRINRRAGEMLGYSQEELQTLALADITHADDLPGALERFLSAVNGELESYTLEVRLLRKDGSLLWGYLSVAMKRSSDAAPDHAIVVIEDISALKQAHDSLAAQVKLKTRELQATNDALRASVTQLAIDSATDYLTGLPNRRVFSRRTEEAARAAKSSHEPYGLILLDLDDFKRINDAFGHDVGDEVLRVIGRILSGAMRDSSDLAARLGGEEFGVLCVGLREEHALRAVAERLRDQLCREALSTTLGEVRFTGSFGLALSQPGDADWKTIYGRADGALYEAKSAGKNRVAFGHSVLRDDAARLRSLRLSDGG